MFEKAKPVPQAKDAQKLGGNTERFSGETGLGDDLLISSIDTPLGESEEAGDSLRMIEWSELTARLNAARDLRLVLRQDAGSKAGGDSGSLADVAASYFRTKNHEEPDVNPVALEHFKGSPGMIHNSDQTENQNESGLPSTEAQPRGHAVTGDAREYK